MNKKCQGCGAVFQKSDPNLEGFVKENNYEKSNICERCFRIQNYGDYKVILKDNNDFLPILSDISKTKDLVVLLVDIFQIPKDIEKITNNLNNDVLLVFTKRDLLPKSLKDDRLTSYQKLLTDKVIDTMIISSYKNYELDNLISKIRKYKKTKNVYIVGFTNAGKSTLINKLIYNYSTLESAVTTSILPSTTINTVEIELDENLVLIDTPGIIEQGNLMNYVELKDLKRIIPKKEIKPITYQAKGKQTILIDKFARIDLNNNNLTIYGSNELLIDRSFKIQEIGDMKSHLISVKDYEEIVISGLCFMRLTKSATVQILVPENVNVYKRPRLI